MNKNIILILAVLVISVYSHYGHLSAHLHSEVSDSC
jgi:hypothetical protein